VVAVIGAFELDDEIAAGLGPHQVDRVHRRLGPAVPKTPQRQAVPSGQFLRHDHRVLDRLGKVSPPGNPF
jgi:hypothetical protein